MDDNNMGPTTVAELTDLLNRQRALLLEEGTYADRVEDLAMVVRRDGRVSLRLLEHTKRRDQIDEVFAKAISLDTEFKHSADYD